MACLAAHAHGLRGMSRAGALSSPSAMPAKAPDGGVPVRAAEGNVYCSLPRTAYYFENEKRLLSEHVPDLGRCAMLKTDLWDEVKNTRILQWVHARPQAVCVARRARAGGAPARLPHRLGRSAPPPVRPGRLSGG